jgi:hypothetical protein
MPVPALGLMGFEITGEKQWYWVRRRVAAVQFVGLAST